MDPRLLRYYNRELQHVREMGGEFAKQFPKIAGRLGLEGFECADPYVERLLEGFAFLVARIQLKIDSEFPKFTQHLMEMVYPQYLAPTPSMAVVQLRPDRREGSLAEGFTVKRGSTLKSVLGRGEQTACEYRTAHDVTLWPIEIVEARMSAYSGEVARIEHAVTRDARAALRLRLKTTAGLKFDKVALDRLVVHLRGVDELPMKVYERLLSGTIAVVVSPVSAQPQWHDVLARGSVKRVGFGDDEALLPYGTRSFHGYRLLHEYFAFPQRYMFVEFGGLASSIRKCTGNEVEILVLLDRSDPSLENAIDASNFALHCTPAVNLFPKSADRIHLDQHDNEYHVVPDRTRPLDFEVHSVLRVTGYGSGTESEREFRPFYAIDDPTTDRGGGAFFTVRRMPRPLSDVQRQRGPRSAYLGSESFVSIVDGDEAPLRSDLRQLGIATMCTNRDLPLALTLGTGDTDFIVESGAPVETVRVVAGPTSPRPSWEPGDVSWRLVSHLSLNYLSLADREGLENAAALRELLALYGDLGSASVRRQIEGVRAVTSRPIHRRLRFPGIVAFGRGLEVAVTFDEAAFEGSGVFLLGAVLEQFFARYVSINSFTETVVRTADRGEIVRWPARTGLRTVL